MEPVDTPYVRLHFQRATQAIGLRQQDNVLEVGAGMGRFTRLLARDCHSVTALELSEELAAECRHTVASESNVKVVTADLYQARGIIAGQFDAVMGFFMLHHLSLLPQQLQVVRSMLAPGGRCVFVEPNPLNPLYAVQITVTPGMRWAEERGIYKLWRSQLVTMLTEGGFVEPRIHRYGFLPRWLHNQLDSVGINPLLEQLTPEPLRPFQLISARVDE